MIRRAYPVQCLVAVLSFGVEMLAADAIRTVCLFLLPPSESFSFM